MGKTKIRDKGKKISVSDIEKFELEHNVKIPEDYKNFLLKYNEGFPEQTYFKCGEKFGINVFDGKKNEDVVRISTFLGINPGMDLEDLYDGFDITKKVAKKIKNLFVNFVGYTQAVNVNLSDITVSVRLPYDSSADTIVIKTANVTKSYIIHDYICNKNDVCSGGENYITCPEDCPANSDGICINRIDGVCDPDCGEDLDCQATNNAAESPVDPIPNTPDINSTNPAGGNTNPKPSDDPEVRQSNSSYKYVWFAAIAGIILIIVGIIVGKNIKSVGGGDSQ